ncbi:MAG: hypothetical protein JWR69_295 [Pedosphaera sp.]|nr:hypothetical protein [Pedosphaera sp.]
MLWWLVSLFALAGIPCLLHSIVIGHTFIVVGFRSLPIHFLHYLVPAVFMIICVYPVIGRLSLCQLFRDPGSN